MLEETGLQVRATKLLALTNGRKHPRPAMFLHVYKAFFWCELIGGELKPSIETSEVAFFDKDELPPISTARVTEAQIHQFFELQHGLPENTYFD
ncbi:hypothetical protein F907_02659 [Acinetobacter colistiniresistens]|uniref:Nudix hydrolase domain-containing protein n=1 Tax=Acinetobacter colistiniresistens TaxID=280145 RepID=S3U9G3_9GAMM|nr:hypothetical protein F907_02659 [Acinetobacter colistiniresistens]